MLAGTTFDTEMHTRIGKCDKALEPAINETVNKKKFGKRLTNPDLSIDITVREKKIIIILLYIHNLNLGANKFGNLAGQVWSVPASLCLISLKDRKKADINLLFHLILI